MPWEAVVDPSNKVYYWNSETKQSTWIKPYELQTPLERAIAKSDWNEFTTVEGGVKYWNNAKTGESVWELPAEIHELAKQFANSDEAGNGVDNGSQSGLSSSLATGVQPAAEAQVMQSQVRYDQNKPYESPIHPSRTTSLGSRDADIKAFKEALIRANVGGDKDGPTTWNDAVKVLIKDPGYWILKDPLDRRQCFDAYLTELAVTRRREARLKWESQFQDMTNLLSSDKYSDKIHYYSTWKSFKSILNKEPEFQDADIKQQRYVFHKYIETLRKKRELEIETAKHQEMELLESQFIKMRVSSVDSLWVDVFNSLKESGVLESKFPHLQNIDILITFEEYMKKLERKQNKEWQLEKQKRYRKERKIRQAYVGLLEELRSKGHIKAGTRWRFLIEGSSGNGNVNVNGDNDGNGNSHSNENGTDDSNKNDNSNDNGDISNKIDDKNGNNSTVGGIFPLLEKDDRYIQLCGQEGSTPLELFWDIVEEEDRKIKLNRELVIDILATKKFTVTTSSSSSFDAFLQIIQSDPRGKEFSESYLKDIYDSLLRRYRRSEPSPSLDPSSRHSRRSESISSSHHPRHSSRHGTRILHSNDYYSDRRRGSNDDRYAEERHIRRAQDDFRDALRQLEPPIRTSDTWEDIKPRVSSWPEFLALEEPHRRTAFEKHIRRMKDREYEQLERNRERGRDEYKNNRQRDDDWDRSKYREPERERDRYRERGPDRDRERGPGRAPDIDRERKTEVNPHENERDRERRLRDEERISRNADLRNRPSGRGLDHGPHLEY